MRRLLVEVTRDVPDSAMAWQPPVCREATPDDIRAAFLAQCEEDGSAEKVREFCVGANPDQCESLFDEESCDIATGRIELLGAIGLSVLLDPPKLRVSAAELEAEGPNETKTKGDDR